MYIQNGSREDGVVYPGEENATVSLTPGGTVCSDMTVTSCTAVIMKDDIYTASLTISNDVGSSAPVTQTFDCE